jgi:predicted dehydrogenase
VARLAERADGDVAAEPLRIVQVGLGGWGRSWSLELLQHPELAEILGYVDVAPAMLAALRAELPVPEAACFASLEEAIAGRDVDAVLVTTALPQHAAVAIAALEAGLHVLVEKPLAAGLADATRMVAASDAADRVLMVSQNYRFYPAAHAVAELIADGSLGAPGAVRVGFRKHAGAGGPGHTEVRDPLLMDMAIHHFDLMRYVLHQEPVDVFCHAWNPAWSGFADPAAAIAAITFDGGAVVDYQGSWVSTAAETHWDGEWLIECERGAIVWTGRGEDTTDRDRVRVQPTGEPPVDLPLPRPDRFDRIGAFAEFVAAIREGRAPLTSARSNLPSLALALAAVESARSGARVRLDRPA